MEKKWKLTPVELPKRMGLYEEILASFVAGGEKSVKVDFSDNRSQQSIQNGLKKAIKSEGTKGVDAVKISGQVYLTKV